MKNPTVKDLIQILSNMNQNAIVCHFDMNNNDPIFSSFEICKEFSNVTYFDDDGD